MAKIPTFQGLKKYQIRASVDESVQASWLKWMDEVHIPQVIEAGQFLGCEMEKVKGPIDSTSSIYLMSYLYDSPETLQAYLDHHANALRDDHMEKFPEGVKAERELIEGGKDFGYGCSELVFQFWREVAPKLGLEDHHIPHAYAFGDSEEMAEDLLALVLSGKKSATSSLYRDYNLAIELPKIGDYFILTDGKAIPKAVIRTSKLEIQRFLDVDEDVAKAEGEGDLSLNYWRKAHQEFFKRQNSDFSESDLILTEYFELIWPNPVI